MTRKSLAAMPLLMYSFESSSRESIYELSELSSVDDGLVVAPVTLADTLSDPVLNPVFEKDKDDDGEGDTSRAAPNSTASSQRWRTQAASAIMGTPMRLHRTLRFLMSCLVLFRNTRSCTML